MTAFIPSVKKYLEKAIDVLLVFFLSGIFLIGICQVFWRWVLNDPLTWSEEAIQLIYIWVCYLGWCLAERKDAHIRITAVMNALPKNAQKWLQAEASMASQLEEKGCTVITPDATIKEATVPYIQPLVEDWDLIQSYAD